MIKSETATTNAYNVLHKMQLTVSILTSTELYQIRQTKITLQET